MEEPPPIWMVATSSRGEPTKGDPPALALGEVLTTPRLQNWPCYDKDTFASGMVLPKQ